MEVLLTGTESAKGIVAARALGTQGINFITSSHKKNTPASYSKYSSGHVVYSDPLVEPVKFINDLISIIKSNNIKVLMPLHSRETKIISKNKKVLEEVVSIPLVDYKKFSLVDNKRSLNQIATKLNLRTPKTIFPKNLGDLKNLDLKFPLVIKIQEGQGNKGLSYANNYEELHHNFESTIKKHNLKLDNYPIVQEYIEGKGLGTSVLYSNGKMQAFLSHLRLRENPPSGGPSTFRVSLRNKKAEKISKKLMDYIGWHGIAMLEFKLDNQTNEPYLIEVNPRFWGSMYQPIASGLNFPYWLYLISQNKSLNFKKEVALGIKTRFLALDIISFLAHFRYNNDKLRFLKSYLSFKDTRFDLESFQDFRPIFLYYIECLRKLNL